MELNLDKCPECGYINKNHPDTCPSCGCDLVEHRIKVKNELNRLKAEAKNNEDYLNAINEFTEGRYSAALVLFLALGKYKDAEEYVEKSKIELYTIAIKEFNDNALLKILHQQENKEYSTCKKVLLEAVSIEEKGISRIKKEFSRIKDFRDSRKYIDDCTVAISFLKKYENEKKEEEKRLKKEKEKIERKEKEKKEAEEERKRAQEAERERIRKEQQRIEDEKKRNIRSGVSLGLLIVIIASIFIGIVLNNKKKEEEARIDELRYGCSHISMTIDSKTNGEQSYNYYITNLKITIKNDCQRDITYLDCNLLINSVDSNVQLWKGDVTLNGNVSSYGGNSSWNLELKSTSNELWNYPLEGLKIQCKWTSARFDEPNSYTTSKTYDDSYKVIYSGNVNYKSNMYQQAKNYYNQGKYQDAYDIFEQLGSYLDSASWVEKCVEKIAEQNRLESVNQFKQYLSYIDNNIPVPSKVEYWGTAGIGTTHYEGSDRNCVYGQGYIYNMVNGLTFISDYESELITAGYTKVTGGSYYNTCDYYYEKGGVVIGFNNLVNNYYDYYFYMVAFKVN